MFKIPFAYGRVVDRPFFINRVSELKRLESNFVSGQNTVIISPRRWGKSSLVHMAAKRMTKANKAYAVCMLDLFNIRSEKEFYEALVKSVLKATSSKWEEWLESGKRFFSSIIPTFSVGLDPERDFSVSIDFSKKLVDVEEILQFPERLAKAKGLMLIICIDEFQNLSLYENPVAFQKKLRSVWQRHKHACYCLYGSKRHMITDIFENKSMPFYKFGDVMFLEKIKPDHWIDYIYTAFKATQKKITKETAFRIAEEMKSHPYFVQQLAQKVWTMTEQVATDQTVTTALNHLLYENSILYIREVEALTNSQVNFLKAVVDNVTQFSSAQTLRTYQLGTSANVLRIKSALENKEIIDFMGQQPEFIDPLFEFWMKEIYFKK